MSLGTAGSRAASWRSRSAVIVVGEDSLLRPAVPDAGDHGRVVRGVREEDATGEMRAERGKARFVGRVAGGEEERRLGAVKVRELLLEQHVVVRRAGDVARAAGARAVPVDRVLHRGANDIVLAHSEIVVRAPHRDFHRSGRRVVYRSWETAVSPLKIRKDSVPALRLEVLDTVSEESFVVQGLGPRSASGLDGAMAGREWPCRGRNGNPRAGVAASGEARSRQTVSRRGEWTPPGGDGRDPPPDKARKRWRVESRHRPRAVPPPDSIGRRSPGTLERSHA